MGLFDSINPLVKIAKQVVNGVRQSLMGQVNLLDTAVKAPIQMMVKEVVGGVWVGEGADAFVEQCTRMFIPQTDFITNGARAMHAGIGKALDIMEAADKKSTGFVNNVGGLFSNIYKG
ncbi:MAG: hypothetical protein H6656_00180 [Ardenticatenaceae bacterium]|nr:hypothetical protein [Ardenticatenaceae bacterium]